ncbi:MAG: SPFH domain-containing protein [Planctomycetota bacterium]|nr:SPFH domain-containing protein [Planctomycetota bacterium]
MAHDHDHDHDHEHDEPAGAGGGAGEFDIAGKSLADALRVSFRVLTGIMVLVFAGFGLTGVKSIDPNHRGLKTVFGQIEGVPSGPGLTYTWPFPIGRIVSVPSGTQSISMDDFWMFETAELRDTPLDKRPIPTDGLDPTRDGALLTGDRNLIHVRFDVTYAVSDALAAETNVKGYEEFVRAAIRRAAVLTASKWTADAIMLMKETTVSGKRGQPQAGATFAAAVRYAAQARLNEMQAGVEILTLNPKLVTLPLGVLKSYEAVRTAESKAHTARAEAAYEASQALNKAAGANYRILLGDPDRPAATQPADGKTDKPYNLIAQYDRAAQAGQDKEAAALMELIGQKLESNEIGGQAGQLVALARAEEARIVQETETWVERYKKLLPHYKTMGSTLLELELASTLEKMFASPTVEKVVLHSGKQKVVLQTSEDADTVERIHKAIAALRAQREKALKDKMGAPEQPQGGG